MAEPKKKPSERDINPTNMAGARRLLADPDAFDEALERGLLKSQPDPTYDDTRRRK